MVCASINTRRTTRDRRINAHQKVENAEAKHRERDADVSVVVEEIEHADAQATETSQSGIYIIISQNDDITKTVPVADWSKNRPLAQPSTVVVRRVCCVTTCQHNTININPNKRLSWRRGTARRSVTIEELVKLMLWPEFETVIIVCNRQIQWCTTARRLKRFTAGEYCEGHSRSSEIDTYHFLLVMCNNQFSIFNHLRGLLQLFTTCDRPYWRAGLCPAAR